MRPIALVGLVVSLLLGAIGVSVTLETERQRANEQDNALLAATSSETALITDGERQTNTALSLLLVNPAVRDLLGPARLAPGERRADRAASARALSTIRTTGFVAFTAACLDSASGIELVCSPAARSANFPTRLGARFVRLAHGARVGTASGLFLSPVSGQLSVALLGPLSMGGRLRGLVHLDISVADTAGSTLEVAHTPGVQLQLGSYAGEDISLDTARAPISQGSLEVGELHGSRPLNTLNAGHRAAAAALPLTIGGAEHVAVVATAIAAAPSLWNSWSSDMAALMGIALALLVGSIVALVLSARGVRRELSTDPLTGLYNRRALMTELPRACDRATEDQPSYLWFFDLNGFKQYNDSFGHVSGDALLARLGARMKEAVEPFGAAYRLGGDEFCVLVCQPVEDPHALFLQAREALVERGGGFSISAAAGAVELPREADSPTQALRLADQRMYREKATSRGGGAEVITAVLQAALAQRDPYVGGHSGDVAGDVRTLARTIGLDEQSTEAIVKAGDLHDIGKLGIPDEILTRPGALSADEWEFMKRHTLMGEQIIAAAGPSLEHIAPLVRSSHERWDGGGYPDGLAGEQIPMGARIISICDSFRAMIDERPYKSAMSVQDALDELRRCAGTQFDPELVDVFCRVVGERLTRDSLADRA
ncbi:MAG TPA: diguanylate cyclase [Solirubrobacteraceae bacterium]|jgi:diguanylate cyclase (GGDEF)-like protein|nr:diguanylate cyclase [Solirubrobacteraceae bacterium]